MNPRCNLVLNAALGAKAADAWRARVAEIRVLHASMLLQRGRPLCACKRHTVKVGTCASCRSANRKRVKRILARLRQLAPAGAERLPAAGAQEGGLVHLEEAGHAERVVAAGEA